VIDLLIVDADALAALELGELVRRLRRSYPSVPLILYSRLTDDAMHSTLRLAKAGIDEVILEGKDDDRRTLERIALTAHRSRCAERSLTAVGATLSPHVREILAETLETPGRRVEVEELADALGVTRKTLVNRLTAAGLPGPETVISWCRLLMACELLEDPGRTVEQVALLLGFGSGVALRNMFRRHLRARPSDLRSRGGLELAVHRLFGAPSSHAPRRDTRDPSATVPTRPSPFQDYPLDDCAVL
jgi:AraC-like DNA-binding protein